MEALWIVIAIIWFVARAAANKKATNQNKSEKATGLGKAFRELQNALETPEKAGGAAKTAAPPVAQAAVPDGRPSAAAAADLAQASLAASYYSEGESRIDDEGCVGGSMEHGHDEGSAQQTAQSARQPNADGYKEEEAPKPRMTAAQMRQAVVASEVLRAPLALRGKKRGFAR